MKENKKSEIFWRQHVCRRHARKLSNKHLMPFGPTSGCWCLLVSWHRLSPTIGLLFLSLVSLSTTSGQGPTKGVMSLRNQRKQRPIVSKIPVVFFLLIGIFGLWLALLLWSQTTNVSHADSRGYRSAIHTKIPLRKKTGIFGFFSPTEGWLG